jgi:hypothetical protein
MEAKQSFWWGGLLLNARPEDQEGEGILALRWMLMKEVARIEGRCNWLGIVSSGGLEY